MCESIFVFRIVEPPALPRRMWERHHHRTLAELQPDSRLQRTWSEEAHYRKLADEDQHRGSQHAQLRIEPVRAVGDACGRWSEVTCAAWIATGKTAHECGDVGGAAKFLSRLEPGPQHPAIQLFAGAPRKRPPGLALCWSWGLSHEQELRAPAGREGRRRLGDDALVGADGAAPQRSLMGGELGTGG